MCIKNLLLILYVLHQYIDYADDDNDDDDDEAFARVVSESDLLTSLIPHHPQ